jgi:hypothetical protein
VYILVGVCVNWTRCLPLVETDGSVAHALVDANGADLSRLPDFEVPASVTSADFWEAAYRQERAVRVAEARSKAAAVREHEVLLYETVTMVVYRSLTALHGSLADLDKK